jgi:hypothetical protein
MHMFLVGILCLLFPNQALENIPQGEVGKSLKKAKLLCHQHDVELMSSETTDTDF